MGGAEFRLPVLAGPLHYSAKQSVPLNLAISLITVASALAIRSSAFPLQEIGSLMPIILAMIFGAVFAAFFGANYASRVSEIWLKKLILVLLVAIGVALIVEAFLSNQGTGFIPDVTIWRILSAILFGLLIGSVSSLLGVAGGEMIIPTLIFAYGAGVKIAGTAGLLVSLPTIIIGLIGYARRGAFSEKRVFKETVIPMGVGSIIGAIIGGLLLGIVSSQILKIVLGLILIVSAFRIFKHKSH